MNVRRNDRKAAQRQTEGERGGQSETDNCEIKQNHRGKEGRKNDGEREEIESGKRLEGRLRTPPHLL